MKVAPSRVALLPVPIRLGIFIFCLLVLWLPIAGLIYWLGGSSNKAGAVAMLVLYAEFVFLLRVWGGKVNRQPQPLRYYGLRGGTDLVVGLGLGLLSLVALFVLEGSLGWLVWQSSSASELIKIVLEGLGVALGVGVAEELLFRGWLLDELERDYQPATSLWICSVLFALLHFIKPLAVIRQSWPQFLGLLLLGLTLVWAKRLRQGSLGLAIGLHAGLVWGYYVVDVADLVNYSGRVPTWVTGVNHPLAGMMGVLFLACIAVGLRGLIRLQLPRADSSVKSDYKKAIH